MKNLFIDSNIWLSLYYFTNDDLEQFSKLKNYIENEIKLYVPQQVRDEIRRNREAKLKETFETFDIRSIQYPAFCKGYEQYEQFSKDYNEILKRYKEWKKQIDKDIYNECLPADITINELFSKLNLIPCEDYVNNALIRYRKGNPPGKDNKYGDAINWECLLNIVPNGEDLYFISADKDYKSRFSDDKINPFLKKEWYEKKKSNIIFYKDLVSFLNQHLEDIQLITEQEKQTLIEKLKMSASFSATHNCINDLSKYSGWTDSQVEELCLIAEENNQVSWILKDIDVANFYVNLLTRYDYTKLEDSPIKRIKIELEEGNEIT